MFPTGNIQAAWPPENAAKRPVRNRHLCELIRGLQNLESPCKGDGFILFASAKRTKKQLLGRAKSCQWQVFVRRRPPKQGELRTDVSKATMFQGVDSVLRPRFKTLWIMFFSCCFRFLSLNRHVLRPTFLDVLNRCERVIVVKTQD